MITIQFKGGRGPILLSPSDEYQINMSLIDDIWYIQIAQASVEKVRKLINHQIFISYGGGFLYGELAKNVLMNWNSVR